MPVAVKALFFSHIYNALALGEDLGRTVADLKRLKSIIEYAEPNYIVTRTGSFEQPSRKPKNGASRSGIGVPGAWHQTTGSRETIIAVIDTGIDRKHPNLTRNLWVSWAEAGGERNTDDDHNGYLDDEFGWNFVDNSLDVTDDNGHGTAVAGIIAATPNPDRGVSGVMRQASIMPLKALDRAGDGTVADVVEAIAYATAHRAAVINCSLGTEGYSQALLDAINSASKSGTLVVASSGNGGRDLSRSPYYPASYAASNLITVAASTNENQLADFSNWGAGNVQVAAPGVDLVTIYPGRSYVSLTGTSASAPLVAGVAGLLKTLRGWSSAQMIRQSLIDGARRSNDLSGKIASSGVVSAERSIALFLDGGNRGGIGGGDSHHSPLPERPDSINLKYLRDRRPHRALPHPLVKNAPRAASPAVMQTDQIDSDAVSLPQNAVGAPGSTIGREADPTVASSATGGQTVVLGSQNVNFSAPVLSLGGRGGIGTDLTLSYNSNSVWIRNPQSNTLTFNIDRTSSPGWQFGLGRIRGQVIGGYTWSWPIWNGTLGAYTYIWIEPDGTRRTLVGTSSIQGGVYRSNDSSHIELVYPFGGATPALLKLEDGTQIRFELGSDYEGLYALGLMVANEIKDREGNYITIKNSNNGIEKITDSMGREIVFYYEDRLLKEIRQNRDGVWHVFVRLTYAPVTINTNFNGQTLNPTNVNGKVVNEPWLIEFPNQMNYRFFYTSYGQAYQIEKWTPAIDRQGPERPVAETYYDLPSINGASFPGGPPYGPANNNAAQNDCPKFAIREEWAENWSRNEEGWVLSRGAYNARYSYYLFTDNNGTHTRITDPLGRIFRTDVSANGLTHVNRTWANMASYGSDSSPGQPLKTTTTVYELASDGLNAKELTVTDGSYTRKTGVHYWTQLWISQPDNIIEYESDGSTIYRHTRIFYNTDVACTNRNIFGVVSQRAIYQGSGETTPWSAVSYLYDESAYFDSSDFSVVQHDSVNYGTGMIAGRANVTTVRRYDISTGSWQDIAHTKYNKTGMVTAVTDAAGNTTQYFYEDNFSAPATPPASRGLVTRVKDPDGYWSGTKYNWYTSLPVETYHLAGTSGTGQAENVVSYSYDGMDRIATIRQPQGHGGQTDYTYWDNWLAIGVYTRIDSTKTHYSFTAYDGSGSVRWLGGDHPDGVSDKFWMVRSNYDAVGRAVARSNSTAVSGSGYEPADEDAALGWLYTTSSYDALNRPLVVTEPDGNTTQYSYNGCGCAGSLTMTMTDERGRKRKTVYDFLGRLKEAHNLTAAGATYGKAVYTYDGRDLLTKVEQYDGSGAHQDRVFNYDGYGRLSSQTTPEAGTVTYSHRSNDLVDFIENDRIVSGSTKYRATLNYNGKGQVTQVSYNDQDATPDVYYEYGEYGERTWMREKNDAGTTLASVQYDYDQYKRLQSETRVFQGLAGTFRVSYAYNDADALKQVTYKVNSWEKNVYYDYSFGGALAKVGSDLTGGTATENIAKNFNYRGFHALKNVTYGNGRKLTLGYDQKRSQLTSLQLKKTDGTDPIINLSYDHNSGGGGSAGNNGRIRHVTDHLDSAFSADFGYDDYNRLTSYAATYQRNYSYDPWGNLTAVSGTGGEAPNYTLSYATNGSGAPLNNRIGNSGYTHDPAGNMLSDGAQSLTYDAANRLKTATGGNSSYRYDGDGNRVMQTSSTGTIYYLWSSVLGQPVVEVASSGSSQIYRAYVYSPNGKTLAVQSYNGGLYWVHGDHLGSGRMLTDVNGAMVYRGEFDPHGQALYEWASGGATFLNSRKFTGYERDQATNLDNAKARTYHHNRGRFMQPDPLGLGAADLTNPQSLNLYSYVQNDPVNFTDPQGLEMKIDDLFGGGGFGGGGFGGGGFGGGGFWGWDHDVSYGGSGSWGTGWGSIDDRPRAGIGVIRDAEREFHERNFEGWNLPFHSIFEGWDPSYGWQDGGKNGGGKDQSTLPTAIGVCGAASSFAEYSTEVGDSWKGANGNWYSKSWGGNQYAGSKTAALNRAASYRLLGKGMFAVSAGISTYQGVQSLRQGDYAGAAKSGLDITMGAVGIFGGPIGAGVSGAYFAIDTFVGWDNVAKFARDKLSNLKMAPGSRCW